MNRRALVRDRGISGALFALIAAAVLLFAPYAGARSSAYQSYNVSGRGSAQWQGFSPTWNSRVKEWLDSANGITIATGVSVWADQSPSANNASQATGAKQATYAASDSAFGGQPSLAFASASSQCMTMGATFGAQPFTVYIVGQSSSGAGQQQFYGDVTNNVTGPYWTGAGWSLFGGSSLSSGNATRSPAVFAAKWNGASSSIFVGAITALATGNAGSNNPASTQALGCYAGTADYLNGKMTAFIIDAGVDDPSFFAREMTWLASRYALAIGK